MAKVYKLLEVKDLNTSFKIDAGRVLAVNGVSFSVEKGKVLGIVGESGSGKSVTAYSIMRILDKNGHIDSGKILYKGTDLCKLSEAQMRKIRGNNISIIFQDAMTSLNPVWTIGNQLREAILAHSKDPVKEALQPIENEIISDYQRIASISKGISHHPDNLSLQEDLEFVKKKLENDKANLEKTKIETNKRIAEGEKEMAKVYRQKKPEKTKPIRENLLNYLKNFFNFKPKPSEEEALKNKNVAEAKSNFLDAQSNLEKEKEALNKAIEAYENACNELSSFKEKNEEYQNLYNLKASYRNDIFKAKGVVRTANKKLNESKRKYKSERRKFNNSVVYSVRREYFAKWKQARNDLRNFKGECKSAYRETKYTANLKALQMLKEVGITEPEKRMKQYPFELSGGMLQRCMIAMALVQKPDILIADEPTTALDVTIQAQILDLLKNLQKEYGMAIIIITHDLGVVAQICDEVDVMYAGRIVERGSVRDIFYNPQHEYTKGLLKSMPKLDQGKEKLVPISGNPVDLFCLPRGCAFSSRCKNCMKICLEKYPEEVECDESGHAASCWAMVKRLHEEGIIDVKDGKPEGKPLVYNGAVIHQNLQQESKRRK